MKISIEERTKLKYATDRFNDDRTLDYVEISEFNGTKAELLAILEIIKENNYPSDWNPPYNPTNPFRITCSQQRPEGTWCGSTPTNWQQ